MLNISYNVSPRLNEYLGRIEDLRKEILMAPLSPARTLQLQWEAISNRIHYSLKLAGNPMKKTEMLKLLSEIAHKKTTEDQKAILGYKKALDSISQNWQGSRQAIDATAIIDLHKIIGSGRLRVPQAGLQYLLDYLQSKTESPIIQAAIACIEMEKMQLFTEYNGLIARLTADIFLYKYGYDFKGFLAYEAAWMKDEKTFQENHERALSAVSLTLWLEYFAENILNQLEEISQSIKNPKLETTGSKESFWELNERQKSILSYLNQPQVTITNRQVQKKHKISQITASRDLAKLASLGYLFSHGKGRSVYYTKI